MTQDACPVKLYSSKIEQHNPKQRSSAFSASTVPKPQNMWMLQEIHKLLLSNNIIVDV